MNSKKNIPVAMDPGITKKYLLSEHISILSSLIEALKVDHTSENAHHYESFDLILKKLTKTEGTKAISLLGMGFMNIGIFCFNQGSLQKAQEAFEEALEALELAGPEIKHSKCMIFKAKTLIQLEPNQNSDSEEIRTSISLLKTVAHWLQAQKAATDAKIAAELRELHSTVEYEMAVANRELGMREWDRKKREGHMSASALNALWTSCKWWSKVLAKDNDASSSYKLFKAALQSLIPVADLFGLLEYGLQQVALLKLLLTSSEVHTHASAPVLRAQLAHAYSVLGFPASALRHFKRAHLHVTEHVNRAGKRDAKELDDAESRDWRDRGLLQLAVASIHVAREGTDSEPMSPEAWQQLEAMTTRTVSLRDDKVLIAEVHHALSLRHESMDVVEALRHAKLSYRNWQVVFHRKETGEQGGAYHKQWDLARALKKWSVFRCTASFGTCLNNLGVLYQAQGNMHLAQHYFVKGLDLAKGTNCPALIARFLLRLSRLDCSRHALDKSQARLSEAGELQSQGSRSLGHTVTLVTPGQTDNGTKEAKESLGSFNIVNLSEVVTLLLRGEVLGRQGLTRQALDQFRAAQSLISDRNLKEPEVGLFENCLLPATVRAEENRTTLVHPLLQEARRQVAVALSEEANGSTKEGAKAKEVADFLQANLNKAPLGLLRYCLEQLHELAATDPKQPESALLALWRGKVRVKQAVAELEEVGLLPLEGPDRLLEQVWAATPSAALSAALEAANAELSAALHGCFTLQPPQMMVDITRTLVQLSGGADPWWSTYLLDASVAIAAKQNVRLLLRENGKPDDHKDASSQHPEDLNEDFETRTRVAKVFSRANSPAEDLQHLKEHLQQLPEEWTVCILALSEQPPSRAPQLLISQIRRVGPDLLPIVLRVPLPHTSKQTGEAQEGLAKSSKITSKSAPARTKRAQSTPNPSTGSLKEVMAAFRDIMGRNTLNLAQSREVAESKSEAKRSVWWDTRNTLDAELQIFLALLEDAWLGPWKGVLLGKEVQKPGQRDALATCLDALVKKFCKLLPRIASPHSQYLLQLLLRSLATSSPDCISPSALHTAVSWVLGRDESPCPHISALVTDMITSAPSLMLDYRADESLPAQKNVSSQKTKGKSRAQATPIADSDEKSKIGDEASAHQNERATLGPLILILSKELQHFPWENIPILKGRTVCRSPSLVFLASSLVQFMPPPSFPTPPSPRKSKPSKKSAATASCPPKQVPAKLRELDASKAFYVLNPSQDLVATQSRFEEPLKSMQWPGIVGQAPTVADMSSALMNYDLFAYMGHSGGQQYISFEEIARLRVRAAALLMGCSSGAMPYEGDFEPSGAPLMYLSAGCPLVLANLWDVTDKDSDNLTKVLLEHCGVIFQDTDTSKRDPGLSLADILPAARAACKLKYLNGAAAICYGLPLTFKKTYM